MIFQSIARKFSLTDLTSYTIFPGISPLLFSTRIQMDFCLFLAFFRENCGKKGTPQLHNVHHTEVLKSRSFFWRRLISHQFHNLQFSHSGLHSGVHNEKSEHKVQLSSLHRTFLFCMFYNLFQGFFRIWISCKNCTDSYRYCIHSRKKY